MMIPGMQSPPEGGFEQGGLRGGMGGGMRGEFNGQFDPDIFKELLARRMEERGLGGGGRMGIRQPPPSGGFYAGGSQYQPAPSPGYYSPPDRMGAFRGEPMDIYALMNGMG